MIICASDIFDHSLWFDIVLPPNVPTNIRYTVVSRLSAHGRLNITCDFGLDGHLPGIKIPYVCIEAATVAP